LVVATNAGLANNGYEITERLTRDDGLRSGLLSAAYGKSSTPNHVIIGWLNERYGAVRARIRR
jgi:hypothetical protein